MVRLDSMSSDFNLVYHEVSRVNIELSLFWVGPDQVWSEARIYGLSTHPLELGGFRNLLHIPFAEPSVGELEDYERQFEKHDWF